MISRKRATSLFLSLFIALAVLAGSWQTAFAVFEDENHHSQGRQGIFVPAGGVQVQGIRMEKVDHKQVWTPFEVNRPMVDLHFDNTSGSIPTSMTYVYFNINGSERRAWDQGQLSIMYWDVADETWKTCPTFLVRNKNEEEGRQRQSGRLACVAPQITTYTLARSTAGFSSFPSFSPPQAGDQ